MKFIKRILATYQIRSSDEVTEDESEGGAGDVKGTEPGEKDYKRLEDMKAKAAGDEVKLLKLAMNMADAINKGGGAASREKAQRRAKAAEEVFPGKVGKTLSMIFMRAS